MKILIRNKIISVIKQLSKRYGNRKEYSIGQIRKVIESKKISKRYELHIFCLFLNKNDFVHLYGEESDYDNCRKYVFEKIFKILNYQFVDDYLLLFNIRNKDLYGPNDSNDFKYTQW